MMINYGTRKRELDDLHRDCSKLYNRVADGHVKNTESILYLLDLNKSLIVLLNEIYAEMSKSK